jgi:hypothetical protein
MAYPKPIPTSLPQARGLSSYLQMSSATDPRAANYRPPVYGPSNQLNAYGAPIARGTVLGETRVAPTDTYTGQFLQPTPGPAPTANNNNDNESRVNPMDALLRNWQNMTGKLRGARDEGMNYYRDAEAALGRKRGEITQAYDDTRQDIFNTSESGRGQLQETAEGSGAQLTNRLLSQGVAGSALDYWKNKQEASKMGQLGDLLKRKESSDRGNLANKQSQDNWALGQEEAIGRGREGLQRTYQEGLNTAVDAQQGTLENLYSQAIAQRAALESAIGGINSQSINRFAPVGLGGSDIAGLVSGLGSMLGQAPQVVTGGGQQSINPQLEGMSLLDQEARRRALLR